MTRINRRRLLASTAVFAGLAIVARSARAVTAGPIEITDAWARASGTALETVAYMTVINHGTEADWLVGISSARAEHVELRRRVWHGLVAELATLPKLAIPAMARTKLEPGGVEIHLTGLTEAIHDQDELPLTATFAQAGQIDVVARVTRFYLGGSGQN